MFFESTFKTPVVHLILIVFIFFGCAERQPKPVQIVQKGDKKKSCETINSELKKIDEEISFRHPKIKETEDYNRGVGVIVAFFPPLIPFSIISDIRKADEVELSALQKRYNYMVEIERQNGCGYEHSFRPVREVNSIFR